MKVVLRWLDIVVYLVFLAYAVLSGPHVTPWYVGLCLAAVSFPFWLLARWQLGRSFSVGWSAVIIWLIVVVVEFGRARREDRVLAEAFGAEYEAYKSRTWF